MSIFALWNICQKKRYDEIAAELDHLIHVVYPEVREHVAETGSQGDRSENAGYREARRRQAKTISRIRFLQKVLEHSRVIDPDAQNPSGILRLRIESISFD